MRRYASVTVLIVEDEVGISKLLVTSLEAEQYLVFLSEDGGSAMQELQQRDFDIVILDLMLPKIDGMTVLKKIKDSDTHRDIPVLVLTNIESPELEAECRKFPTTDYLVKVNTSISEIKTKIYQMIYGDEIPEEE